MFYQSYVLALRHEVKKMHRLVFYVFFSSFLFLMCCCCCCFLMCFSVVIVGSWVYIYHQEDQICVVSGLVNVVVNAVVNVVVNVAVNAMVMILTLPLHLCPLCHSRHSHHHYLLMLHLEDERIHCDLQQTMQQEHETMVSQVD